jgi:hypothetical protein
VLAERAVVVQAENGLRVAGVNCEKHRAAKYRGGDALVLVV